MRLSMIRRNVRLGLMIYCSCSCSLLMNEKSISKGYHHFSCYGQANALKIFIKPRSMDNYMCPHRLSLFLQLFFGTQKGIQREFVASSFVNNKVAISHKNGIFAPNERKSFAIEYSASLQTNKIELFPRGVFHSKGRVFVR